MSRRIGKLTGLAAFATLLLSLTLVPPASAATTGKLGAMVSFSHGSTFNQSVDDVYCGGSLSTSTATNENTVGVSYVCQYSVVGSGSWTSYGNAPASTCNTCAGTNYNDTALVFPCGNLPYHNYLFRAHVDGWWVDGSGKRHDVSAINSPNTLEVDCTRQPGSTGGQLAALVSVSGSTGGSGPTVNCGGSNSMNPAVGAREILVSYVCQKTKSGGSTWSDVGTPPATDLSSAYGTQYNSVNKDCSNFGSGTWDIRARVDGYWVDAGGTKHSLTAIYSQSKVTVFC